MPSPFSASVFAESLTNSRRLASADSFCSPPTESFANSSHPSAVTYGMIVPFTHGT